MARQRLSWKKDADTSKTADPYTMNQNRKNPPIEKYRTGDPSSWAEDPDMKTPWESEGRTETGHPAPAREAVKAARKLEDRAIKCITIAQRMLPGASDDVIEEQATDLMYLPDNSILSTLQRQASLAETLTAKDCDEDDDEDEKSVEAKEKEEKVEEDEEEKPVEAKEKKEEKEEKAEEDEEKPVEAKEKKEEKEEKVEEEEEKPVEAKEKKEKKEEEEEEKKPEEVPEEAVSASETDLLDKIFATEEPAQEKSGAKKLSGIVKKASSGNLLDNLWDSPPDVSKVFSSK